MRTRKENRLKKQKKNHQKYEITLTENQPYIKGYKAKLPYNAKNEKQQEPAHAMQLLRWIGLHGFCNFPYKWRELTMHARAN